MVNPSLVARMLGEREMPPDVETEIPEPDALAPETGDTGGGEASAAQYTNPDVESLVNLWQSGNYSAVALRVLDALDHYRDFVELLYRIGHDDALKLGEIMDDLTADQQSPHKFDELPDEEVPGKLPVPRASEPEAALDSEEPPRFDEVAGVLQEAPEGTPDDESGGDKDGEEDQDWNPNRNKKWSKMLAKLKARRNEAAETPFQTALRGSIRQYVKAARADGVTSMSVENLMQTVRPPASNLAGAPRGTNARYYYAQLFRETCQDSSIAPCVAMGAKGAA